MAKAITQGVKFDDKMILLALNRSRLGNSASVDPEEVGSELTTAQKKSLRVTLQLLDSKELKAIRKLDHRTRRWVHMNSFPAPVIKSSVHAVAKAQVIEIEKGLGKAATERRKLVKALVAAYPERVQESKTRLGKLFDATNYLAVEEVEMAFSMTWNWIAWEAPESLKAIDPEMFEKAQRKLDEQTATAMDGFRNVLRVVAQGATDHLLERLKGDNKKIKKSAFTKCEKFLATFDIKNVTNDEELTKLTTMLKKLLDGVDVEALRDDEQQAKTLAKAVQEINDTLDGMLETRPRRAVVRKGEEV